MQYAKKATKMHGPTSELSSSPITRSMHMYASAVVTMMMKYLPMKTTTSETTPTAAMRMRLRAIRKKAFFADVQKFVP